MLNLHVSGESDSNPVAEFKERNKAKPKAKSKNSTHAGYEVNCCHPSYSLILCREELYYILQYSGHLEISGPMRSC